MSIARVRLLLALDVVAVVASALAVLLAVGLPLSAHGGFGPAALLAVSIAAGIAATAVGVVLLFRSVARPLDRLFAAAARLARRPGELPAVLEGSEGGLGAAAAAFARLGAALEDERARLDAKVRELSAANAALADTRESLLRSERLATVGRLAAGVAHEVGNPLGAITGYADLAASRLPAGAAEARDFLARIAAEAGRIDAIVRDLLDFARPGELRLSPVSLAAVVDGAARLARMQARFKGVAVAVAIPPELPRVAADERRLSQVLVNVLLNAGDAMGGGGEVRIVASAEGGAVALRLEDRGPGIPPGDLPRVFDPFFTTKPPGQGTGLGLAICHRLMETLGGAISAANAPGGGAVFTLRLRAVPADEPVAAAAAGGAP